MVFVVLVMMMFVIVIVGIVRIILMMVLMLPVIMRITVVVSVLLMLLLPMLHQYMTYSLWLKVKDLTHACSPTSLLQLLQQLLHPTHLTFHHPTRGLRIHHWRHQSGLHQIHVRLLHQSADHSSTNKM